MVSGAFSRLESEFGARLGVYGLDTGTLKTISYRATERFAYASTSKVLLAAAELAKHGPHALDGIVRYTHDDLVEYSPVTEKHIGDGMPLREVIAAALQYNDNTASNLMFRDLGGPAALGAALRALGDATTHVDRIEPDLNEASPGDIRDTTTPEALGTSLDAYALGEGLPKEDQASLAEWMKASTTGATLIRAGVPKGWVVGDKSGGGQYAARTDIAVIWPPHRPPVVLVIMSSKDNKNAKWDDALIAGAAKEAIAALE